MSSLPPIRSKHRVCVICEGYEDYHYFKRLMDLITPAIKHCHRGSRTNFKMIDM